jgi:NADH:ubiquinone oxidoreductase subunit 3 (subunit A)
MDLVLAIPLIFGISFLVGILIYLAGSHVSARIPRKTQLGFTPYACGEAFLTTKLQVNLENFFLYLSFFLIFDVAAFLLVLSYERPGFYPIIFCLVIIVNISTLFPLWRHTRNGTH